MWTSWHVLGEIALRTSVIYLLVLVGIPHEWQTAGSRCPAVIPTKTLFGLVPVLSLVFLPHDGQVPSAIGMTFR